MMRFGAYRTVDISWTSGRKRWEMGANGADIASQAPLLRLLEGSEDAVRGISAYLTWQDLASATRSCRTAASSPWRAAFFGRSRVVAISRPLSSAPWQSLVASNAVRALCIAETDVCSAVETPLDVVQSLCIAPQRFQAPTPVLELSRIVSVFPRLQHVDLSQLRSITDISDLASLELLCRLNVSETSVTDLTPLSTMSTLQCVDVSNTKISTIEPLRSLPLLQSLNLDATSSLCDFSPLSSLPSLTELTLGRLRKSVHGQMMLVLQEIAPRLSKLVYRHSQYQSPPVDSNIVDPMTLLRSIQELEIVHRWRLLASLHSFSSLVSLRVLRVSTLNVGDLSPLLGCVNLEELYVTSDRCVDLAPLQVLPRLHTLYCHGGDPDTMDTDGHIISNTIELRALRCLDASNHYLSRLADLPKLQYLRVYVWHGDALMLPIGTASASLRTLALSGDIAIREIHVRFPNLQWFELQQCTQYRAEDISLFTRLESLILKELPTFQLLPSTVLPSLTALSVSGTNVVRVHGISASPNLRVLNLEKTNVNDVAFVTHCPLLQEINLKDTKVMDVSPLISLKNLQKVVLSKGTSCSPLFRSVYDGSALKELREILHPTKNCMWGPHSKPATISSPIRSENEAESLSNMVEKCRIV